MQLTFRHAIFFNFHLNFTFRIDALKRESFWSLQVVFNRHHFKYLLSEYPKCLSLYKCV